MKLKVLASGSSANCYILESPTGTLILEAGLSWKEILKGLNYKLDNVLACLVTHEHKDHSKSLGEVMAAGIDCYYSEGTAYATEIESHRSRFIRAKEPFSVGDFNILPFDTEHDAREPLGFLIEYTPTSERILFITDSYYCKYKFKSVHHILVECNYIKETLDENIEAGYIAPEAKAGLLQGHFSLENVKKFLKANDLSQCQNIVLLHLSDRNSDQNQMVREVEELTGIKPKVAEKGLVVPLQLYPY